MTTARRGPSLPVAAWRAFDRAGEGHAFARRRSETSYCGKPNQPERYDWPVKSRCAGCTAIVEGRP